VELLRERVAVMSDEWSEEEIYRRLSGYERANDGSGKRVERVSRCD